MISKHSFTLLYILCILFALVITACDDDSEQKSVSRYHMGVLPEQSQALIDQEYRIFRAKHPEMDETEARYQFDVIQAMSSESYDAFTASWADRRALALAWLKTQIEAVYSPESVTQELIQEAIDAYAFNSGYPALVTVSHLLIQNSDDIDPKTAHDTLDAIRKELIALPRITDDSLAEAAVRLTQAGFKVNNDRDLTFPRQAVPPFFNEAKHYNLTVEPFSEASFSLSAQNPLSEVVETQFGFHLILFKSKSEEKKADPIKDADFMRSQIVFQGRNLITQQMLQELMSAPGIQAIDRDYFLKKDNQ